MNSSEATVQASQQVGMEPLTPASQQQQSSVVMLNTPSPQSPPLIQSFVGHIVLACFTFCCCGVFGVAALILAVMAQNLSTSPTASDRVAACRLAKTSLWLSVIGIILGTILFIVFLVVWMHFNKKVQHEMEGQCEARGGHFNYITKQCY